MKKLILIVFVAVFSIQTNAQKSDKELVTQACMNYLEGFYQGDKSKLKDALSPTLHKFGYWKSKKSNKYGKKIPMTYDGAMKFAENVVAKNNYAKKGSPKKVKVLDIMDKIATVKVTAYWGTDYMFLAKQDDGSWLIEQVIWQGPNKK